MDVSMNTSAALAQNTGYMAGLTVLNTAINVEAQSAIVLVNSIAQQSSQSVVNLPPNLGQNIDITA